MAQQNAINNRASVFSTTTTCSASGDITSTTGNISTTTGDGISAGITFDGGTNTITRYENSTFVPTVSFGGASVGITYTTQEASYTRINNIVIVRIRVTLSNKGSSTGDNLIEGLPYAATDKGCMGVRWGLLTGAHIKCRTLSSTTTLRLDKVASAGGGLILQETDFQNTSNFQIEGWYITS